MEWAVGWLTRRQWGIGKLIAHLPKRPVFIPFYHIGMTAVLPQHNRWEKGTYNNLVISWDPRHYGRGNKVKVSVPWRGGGKWS